ncbi:hypothetical protein ACFE04_027635 [Oxalis oulophora]
MASITLECGADHLQPKNSKSCSRYNFQSVMAPDLNNVHTNTETPTNGGPQEQSEEGKPWTKEETLTLLHWKNAVENEKNGKHMRSGLQYYMPYEIPPPKWDLIASRCQGNGVQRNVTACKKRWRQLCKNFAKMKAKKSKEKNTSDSNWTMKRTSKNGKRLYSAFDRDIYDIMYGKAVANPLTTIPGDNALSDGDEKVEEEKEEVTPQNGIFTESGQFETGETLPTGSPTMQRTKFPDTGAEKVKGGRKRTHVSSGMNEGGLFGDQVIRALENNNKMLCAQLEAQNKIFEEGRSKQKEITDRLVGAVNTLTNVLTTIADKLDVISGKQVTNRVFRFAKKAGASYINKLKLRHYVHCYALHCPMGCTGL